MTLRLGLAGCGNIGAELCRAVLRGGIDARVAALFDVDSSVAESLRDALELDAAVGDLDACAAASDLLVEAAAPAAVEPVVRASIRHGCDCLVMSVGGVLQRPELLDEARAAGIAVRLPSGALAGLDGIRAAKESGLDAVTLTTRKPPRGLAGAPYLVENEIDVESLTEAAVVFEGTALEAVEAFPKNVNVAAALSLAGIGPERTRVRVVADPTAVRNSHEVVAEGPFGKLTAVTENVPSPENPKTSYLASLSAIAEVRAAALAFEARNRANGD